MLVHTGAPLRHVVTAIDASRSAAAKICRLSTMTTGMTDQEGYTLRISRLTIDKLGVKLRDRVSAVVAELVAKRGMMLMPITCGSSYLLVPCWQLMIPRPKSPSIAATR